MPHYDMHMKPLIGISCCNKPFGQYGMMNHAASDTYVRVVDEVIGGVPVLLPANGEAAHVPTLLSRLDGVLLTGSRSNVLPSLYGGPPHKEGTPEDERRDRMTLRLIRAAIEAGLPLLAVCRGMQELNVALGGTLHQRLQDLPDRLDHSTPILPDPRVRQGKAHEVRVAPGSWLHRVARAERIPVNSLHNQGVDRLAPGLVVEATAPDGTIEAVRAAASRGFVAGVQWHPEYDYRTDEVSRRIFESFGQAITARTLPDLAAAD